MITRIISEAMAADEDKVQSLSLFLDVGESPELYQSRLHFPSSPCTNKFIGQAFLWQHLVYFRTGYGLNHFFA
jgi:hypothetical protein